MDAFDKINSPGNILERIQKQQRAVAQLQRKDVEAEELGEMAKKFVAGGGAWVLDEDGVAVYAANTLDGRNKLRLLDSSGEEVGSIYLDVGELTPGLHIEIGTPVWMEGGLRIGAGSLLGATPATIADNSAISITPNYQYGLLLINMRSAYTYESGIFAYRVSSTNVRMERIAGGVSPDTGLVIKTTTGILGGETGDDGVLTLSAHTDGNIYIENRRGASRSIAYTLLGA